MMQVWRDFAPLLDMFGPQRLEVRLLPPVQIDPDTNEEYYSGAATTDYIAAVVVPAAFMWTTLAGTGAEFLPQGVYEQADFLLFTELSLIGESGRAVPVTVAEGRAQPTVVIIDNETYGIVKNQPWHAGNFRVLVARKSLPGPPLPA